MAKPSLKDFMAEDAARDAAEVQTATTPQPVIGRRGRPKSKPASKLASFHLPLDLIAKLDEEANKVSAGNKSLFIVKLLEDYFGNKKEEV